MFNVCRPCQFEPRHLVSTKHMTIHIIIQSSLLQSPLIIKDRNKSRLWSITQRSYINHSWLHSNLPLNPTVNGASRQFGGSNGHNEISRNEHAQGLICDENGFIILPSATCLTETYVASFSPILVTTSKLARYRRFSKRWFYCALRSQFRLLSSRFRRAFFYCTLPPLL